MVVLRAVDKVWDNSLLISKIKTKVSNIVRVIVRPGLLGLWTSLGISKINISFQGCIRVRLKLETIPTLF